MNYTIAQESPSNFTVSFPKNCRHYGKRRLRRNILRDLLPNFSKNDYNLMIKYEFESSQNGQTVNYSVNIPTAYVIFNQLDHAMLFKLTNK